MKKQCKGGEASRAGSVAAQAEGPQKFKSREVDPCPQNEPGAKPLPFPYITRRGLLWPKRSAGPLAKRSASFWPVMNEKTVQRRVSLRKGGGLRAPPSAYPPPFLRPTLLCTVFPFITGQIAARSESPAGGPDTTTSRDADANN